MNKKLTLGLLVFFVGVLMAACGDDNNTTNTTTTTIPKDFDTFDFGCRSCNKTFSGKFYVQNHQYFEEGFDVDSNSTFGFDTSFDDGNLNPFRPGGLNNIINGILDVGGNILGARAFCNGVDIFIDEDEDDLECDLDTVYGNSDDDLRDTYSSKVTLRVDANNRVTDIDLLISSKADDDYDENVNEDFFDTSDRNVFDGNGGLKMRNNNGRLEVWIGTSKRIGYFRR